MADTPDYNLLKDAYAVVGGIPPQAISLDWNKHKDGPSLTEGTVMHPALWLALHPKFQKKGLSKTDNGKQLLFKGNPAVGTYADALAHLFKLPVADVVSIFSERGSRFGELGSTESDKDIWLKRVRNYLTSHGQLAAAEEKA